MRSKENKAGKGDRECVVGLQFGDYVGKRKGLGEKVTLKLRFEGGEKVSHADIYLAEASLGRRSGKGKGPEVGIWQFERQRGDQVLKQSEKGRVVEMW